MPVDQALDDLITPLQKSVETGLAHYQQLDAAGQIKMGKWGPREPLCHLLYWHQVTAEGLESVAQGGEPVRIDGTVDDMNARAVGRFTGQPVAQLCDKVTQAHGRLVAAARAVPDLNTTIMVYRGTEESAQQRLETLTQYWNARNQELQAL
jgi:hypothetical protein